MCSGSGIDSYRTFSDMRNGPLPLFVMFGYYTCFAGRATCWVACWYAMHSAKSTSDGAF